MNQFPEHKQKAQEAFEAFYNREIEGMIKKSLLSRWAWWIGCIGMVVVCISLKYEPSIFIGLLLVPCFLIVYYHDFIFPYPAKRVFPKIAQYLHMNYLPKSSKKEWPEGLRIAKKLGFMPGSVKHTFVTKQGETEARIFRVDWSQTTGRHVIRLYGLAFAMPLPIPVKGTTILVSDCISTKISGLIHGVKRIKLPTKFLEKKFDLFTTREAETRKLLSPEVMEKLCNYYEIVNPQIAGDVSYYPFVCIFHEGTFCSFYQVGDREDFYDKDVLQTFFCNLYIINHCFIPQFQAITQDDKFI